MKKPQYLWAIALAALPIATQGFSQEVTSIPGSVSTVNLALTLSKTVAGTVAKDANGKPIKKGTEGAGAASSNEWTITDKKGDETTTYEEVTKILTTKYSTKEFLADLVELEIIPDAKGWTIQKMQETISDEGGLDIGTVKFFLAKKGETPISIDSIIALSGSAKISGINLKTVTKVTPGTPEIPEVPAVPATEDTPEIPAVPAVPAVEEVLISESISYSEALKFAGSLVLNVGEYTISTSGIYTGSQKLGKTKAKEDVILSGAGKISSLSGISNSSEIVEGSASFANGAAADVSAY
ncbi:MAG: hypothetical protein OJI67_16610, partial [Prosthecobacter sp.]|nr:hypothetical protein [Prosthecobacter sp.]